MPPTPDPGERSPASPVDGSGATAVDEGGLEPSPRSWGAALALGITAALLVAAAVRVDFDPTVEADFFFSETDPQLQESLALKARYPGGEMVLVRAAARDVASEEYGRRVAELEQALEELAGVSAAYSVATENPASPLWGRILLPQGGGATNLVLTLDSLAGPDFTARLENALSAHEAPDFALVASGVPVIVEQIRRSLRHDLRVFSLAALIVFGVVAGWVYRDARIVGGTLSAGVAACALTLLLTDALGIGVGLLTANIVTIVFVLTLSHTVFIVANWKAAAGGPRERTRQAVARTLPPSLWCMTTTALGFASLWLTSAEPLRELGTAGIMGTLTALTTAYAVLPLWLLGVHQVPVAEGGEKGLKSPGISLPSAGPRTLAVAAVVTVLAGIGILRVQTDPPLVDYFDPDGPIRPGLEAIDRSGGSSPLLMAVTLPDSGRLDTFQGLDAMSRLQDSLEADPATGVVLSPAPLLAHARQLPFAGFLPIAALVAVLERPDFGNLISSYMVPERTEVLYALRMIETDRVEPRDEVVARVTETATRSGFRVVSVGGLYDLQGRLGALISSSLRIGLGGLLALFFGIAWVVSRSARVSAWMLVCLAAIPAIVLGLFGHLGVAVDIITSPAANVALAMGVDSMIHLVARAREIQAGGGALGAWMGARRQLAAPILTAAAVISLGFGIFGLSAFPPTRRFGAAVILGTLTAATAALVILPGLMARRDGVQPVEL